MTVSNTQTIGTLNGSALVVDAGAGVGSGAVASVTLSQTLVLMPPPGWPTQPDQTGAEVAKKATTFTSGTVITTHKVVADRIKALGGGA